MAIVKSTFDFDQMLSNAREAYGEELLRMADEGLEFFFTYTDNVAPSTAADGSEVAFLYNWDGSGAQGDDLYFNVSYNGNTYNFCIEKYLTGADTDVYKAVEALNIGDTIDCEGFLYWYEGANPHITSVTVK